MDAKCRACRQQFQSGDDFRRHILNSECTASNSTTLRTFTCEVCGEIFYHPKPFNRHLDEFQHRKCHYCGVNLPTQAAYNRHRNQEPCEGRLLFNAPRATATIAVSTAVTTTPPLPPPLPPLPTQPPSPLPSNQQSSVAQPEVTRSERSREYTCASCGENFQNQESALRHALRPCYRNLPGASATPDDGLSECQRLRIEYEQQQQQLQSNPSSVPANSANTSSVSVSPTHLCRICQQSFTDEAVYVQHIMGGTCTHIDSTSNIVEERKEVTQQRQETPPEPLGVTSGPRPPSRAPPSSSTGSFMRTRVTASTSIGSNPLLPPSSVPSEASTPSQSVATDATTNEESPTVSLPFFQEETTSSASPQNMPTTMAKQGYEDLKANKLNMLKMNPSFCETQGTSRYIYLDMDHIWYGFVRNGYLFEHIPDATSTRDLQLNFESLTRLLTGEDRSLVRKQVCFYSKIPPKIMSSFAHYGWELVPYESSGNDIHALRTATMRDHLQQGVLPFDFTKKTLVLVTGDSTGLQDTMRGYYRNEWYIEIHSWLHTLDRKLIESQKDHPTQVMIRPMDDPVDRFVELFRIRPQAMPNNSTSRNSTDEGSGGSGGSGEVRSGSASGTQDLRGVIEFMIQDYKEHEAIVTCPILFQLFVNPHTLSCCKKTMSFEAIAMSRANYPGCPFCKRQDYSVDFNPAIQQQVEHFQAQKRKLEEYLRTLGVELPT